MDRLRATNITYLKGVGPARAKLLSKELGINTFADMLYHFPTHYVDRSKIYSISSFSGEMPMVQVKGRFITFNVVGEGAKTRLIGLFTDGTATMEVVWFQRIKRIREMYHTGVEYVIFGKPNYFNGRWSMIHPEVDDARKAELISGLRGVYPLTETLRKKGITSRTLSGLVNEIISKHLSEIAEPLPAEVMAKYKIIGRKEALCRIHSPRNTKEMQDARFRLKFEELFYLQLNLLRYSNKRKNSIGGRRFTTVGRLFNTFYSDYLPFPLTGAQKRVIKEIRADMNTGRQMNRLLQGDVGSGKTLVAVLTILIALDNNCQTCIVAPTEILASQHFESIYKMLSPLGINVKLLTGSTRKKDRDIIHRQLLDGSLHLLISTHAAFEESVQFQNLGYVVIDEQHRFGVAQRAKLWKKSLLPPHVLVMTATPIPRTLAMTVYGDLDVSVINELPPGRKPITTILQYENNRLDVYRAVTRQIKMGRQVYFVHPSIKENDKSELRSLEEGYEDICETFRDFKVTYVHGQMKPDEKEANMQRFVEHQADILVATTVIEVGVNVPNASVMVIENAERFGLSQLHQLRGRVGRGAEQSYCILMSKHKNSGDTQKRLELMTTTTDGFLVAEADLKMRGPGDLEGTLQSGMAINLRIANLASDGMILQYARDMAEHFINQNPDMTNYPLLQKEMKEVFGKSIDWSMIS